MFIEKILCLSRQQTEAPANSTVKDLLGKDELAAFVVCNGKRVAGDVRLEDGKAYHIIPRVLGGKGGFGSMLRAIGAQIEKTTSREACRDLSGRRMRDINNEKKLKEWLAKEAEREQEKEDRKKDRLEKHLRPQHKFDDAEYHEQKAKVQEDLQDALSKGLKRQLKNGEASGVSQSKVSKTEKKTSKAEWLGVDLDSDDLASSDSDTEANPGDSSPSSNSNNDTASRLSQLTTGNTSTETSEKTGTNKNGSINDNFEQGTESITNSSSIDPNCLEFSPTENNALNGKGVPLNEDGVKESTETKTEVPVDSPVDLVEFDSSLELHALGLDRLKHALTVRGLKCGGTLEERAERLWMVRGLNTEEIQASHPSLLAKGGTGKGGKGKKSK